MCGRPRDPYTAMTQDLFDPTEEQPLSEFTEKAYLDYSMYVILDRALPHIVTRVRTSREKKISQMIVL